VIVGMTLMKILVEFRLLTDDSQFVIPSGNDYSIIVVILTPLPIFKFLIVVYQSTQIIGNQLVINEQANISVLIIATLLPTLPFVKKILLYFRHLLKIILNNDGK